MVRMPLPPVAVLLLALGAFVGRASAQTSSQAAPAPAAAPPLLPTQKPPTRADILRGEYGRYRANNDLLFYHLDVRVDPVKKSITGRNTIRFRMLKDDTRIQLDLHANLGVDKILLGQVPLKYEREINTVFVDFPEALRAGREYVIDFYYSGLPKEHGRFGGMAFRKDPSGHDWINTASAQIQVPRVIRLVGYDKLPKQTVKFNRRNIFARDHNQCQYCGKKFPMPELSLDHVIPRSQGGRTTWENIVCACVACNVRKGGRTPKQAHMGLIRKPEKPKRSPVLNLKLTQRKYRSWQSFLDSAYWSVELK